MTEVGVRELKQHLSDYLTRAERGEMIRVTDRGRPKALLIPLPGRLRIEEGIADSWVKPGSGSPLRPVRRVKAARPSLDSLAEDRDE